MILSPTHKDGTLLNVEDLKKASKVFKDIILKCRHWVSSRYILLLLLNPNDFVIYLFIIAQAYTILLCLSL